MLTIQWFQWCSENTNAYGLTTAFRSVIGESCTKGYYFIESNKNCTILWSEMLAFKICNVGSSDFSSRPRNRMPLQNDAISFSIHRFPIKLLNRFIAEKKTRMTRRPLMSFAEAKTDFEVILQFESNFCFNLTIFSRFCLERLNSIKHFISIIPSVRWRGKDGWCSEGGVKASFAWKPSICIPRKWMK